MDNRRSAAQISRGRDAPTPPGGPAIVKIYTRTGDGGETSLFGGERAPKDDPRFAALGSVDELVASLGLAKAELGDGPLAQRITSIQGELYLAMAEIASSAPERGKPPAASLPADATAKLEALIDSLEATLPPLKEFVMPGASRASAALHMARTVCRRAERDAIAAGRTAVIPASVVVYLNRLSDLLFVMARAVDHDAGGSDRTFKSALE